MVVREFFLILFSAMEIEASRPFQVCVENCLCSSFLILVSIFELLFISSLVVVVGVIFSSAIKARDRYLRFFSGIRITSQKIKRKNEGRIRFFFLCGISIASNKIKRK